MSKFFKTIHVETLIEIVNKRNVDSTCSRDMRIGWNCLLEQVMEETGTYAGYGYLEQNDVPKGQLPGIERASDPVDHKFPDDSRRHYYKHRRLA